MGISHLGLIVRFVKVIIGLISVSRLLYWITNKLDFEKTYTEWHGTFTILFSKWLKMKKENYYLV